MKTVWTKGLDKEHINELRGDFTSSLVTRKRLEVLLSGKISDALKGTRTKDGYDCPNWAYKQADSVGYQRALHEVISLLS